MYTNIIPHLWMMADKKVRKLLAERFELPRTGVIEIRDQDVITDGYSIIDLKNITLEKMNDYIGSIETFPRAWELSCAKANYELQPEIKEIKTLETIPADMITSKMAEAGVTTETPLVTREEVVAEIGEKKVEALEATVNNNQKNDKKNK